MGLHELLIESLLSISTKSILFGSFCNEVYEASHIKHSKAIINYLYSAHDHFKNKKEMLTSEEFMPDVLSSFSDRDNQNGIFLREAMPRKMF